MGVARKGTPNWRVHPSAILREEFLKPMGLSAYELAKRLLVPAPRINDIVLERRGYHSGYRCPALPVLQEDGTVLAEFATCVRSKSRESGTRG